MTTKRPCASVAMRSIRRGKAAGCALSGTVAEVRFGSSVGAKLPASTLWARSGCNACSGPEELSALEPKPVHEQLSQIDYVFELHYLLLGAWRFQMVQLSIKSKT